MKILVTGGAGYIGSTLTKMLLDKGYSVRVLDKLMFNQMSLMHLFEYEKFEFVYGDVRDNDLLIKNVSWADVIIPLAAMVGMKACENNRVDAELINYGHINTIVKTISNNQFLVYPNTNSGYGITTGNRECLETDKLTPISTYGLTKCKAEDEVIDRGGAALRLATVFGSSPRMRLDLLVNNFVYKAMTDKSIVLFESHFVRNYIHVRDVARSFVFMIDNKSKTSGEIFNLGLSTANITKLELAEKIKRYIPDLIITTSEVGKDPDKRNYIVSNKKIEDSGFTPKYDLDFGIRELIRSNSIILNCRNEFFNA